MMRVAHALTFIRGPSVDGHAAGGDAGDSGRAGPPFAGVKPCDRQGAEVMTTEQSRQRPGQSDPGRSRRQKGLSHRNPLAEPVAAAWGRL
jgi:hypothetical protein